MPTRVALWEKAVARRRAAIRKAARNISKARSKAARVRRIRNMNNMM